MTALATSDSHILKINEQFWLRDGVRAFWIGVWAKELLLQQDSHTGVIAHIYCTAMGKTLKVHSHLSPPLMYMRHCMLWYIFMCVAGSPLTIDGNLCCVACIVCWALLYNALGCHSQWIAPQHTAHITSSLPYVLAWLHLANPWSEAVVGQICLWIHQTPPSSLEKQ